MVSIARTVKVDLLANVSGYVASMDRAARATRAMANDSAARLAMQRESFEVAGRAAFAFGAATLAAAGLAVKAAVDWESAWAGVTKTNDGTVEELDELQASLRGLAQELPASHAEIAGVAEAAGQLGVAVEDVAAFTKTMIDLGETTNLSANEAATELARFMNVMGTAPEDVERLGASIVGLGNNYATTESEIVQMAQRLSGAGVQIGLSEGEVLGLSTALSSVGIEAEAGGSALSKVMINIASEVETNGPKLELFAKTAGMSGREFTEAWKAEPQKALAAFVTGLANAESQGSSTLQVLADLGITEVRMRDALLRSASAADQFSTAMADGNMYWEENTALLTEAEKRYATTESQLQILGNRVNEAAINLGSVFLPAINDAAEGLGAFSDLLAGMPEPMQELMGTLIVVVGGFALVGGAALMAVPQIARFKLAMATLNMTGLDLVKTFGKGGAVGLAIAAVIGGLSNLGSRADLTTEQLARLNVAVSTGDMAEFESILSETVMGSQDLSDVLNELTNNDVGGWARDFVAASTKFVQGIPLIGGLADASADKFNRSEEAFRQYGESLADVSETDIPKALRGFQALLAETDGSEDSARRLLEVMPEYKAKLIEVAAAAGGATDDQSILNLAMGKGEVAAQLMADAGGGLERVLGDVSAGAADTTGNIDELADAIAAFNEQQYRADDALFNFKESLLDLDEAMAADGFTGTLDLNTQEGIDNSRMLRDLASAANEAAAETVRMTGDQAAGNAVLEEARARLEAVGSQFGLSGDALQEFVDTYLMSPKDLAYQMSVNVSPALQALERLRTELANNKRALDSLNNWRPSSFSYGPPRAGGGILPGAPSRVDNMLIPAASGEYVTNAMASSIPANRAALEYMNAGGNISGWSGGYMTAPSSSGGGSGGVVTAYVDPDLMRAIEKLAAAHRATLDTVGLADAVSAGSARSNAMGAR